METFLLALGGFLPGLAMILACVYLLRRLSASESYGGIAICIAFGFLTIPLALLFIVPLDQFTSRIEQGSIQHGLYSAFVVAGIPEKLVRAIALYWCLGWRRDRLTSRYCLLSAPL
jgi:RsiW-degrading membrane proteinase PrsW (M82 family)